MISRAHPLFALAVAIAACRGETVRRPNVLLISIDTLRADHLSCYGYIRPTSPNIDRLAREGTLFSRAYSASSWTIPSHMTMFTSLPPLLHEVDNVGRRLDPARVTLAARFRDAGYQTAAFVTGPTLHPAFGFDRGFDLYHNTMAFTDEDFTNGDPTRPTQVAHRKSHHAVTGPTVRAAVEGWLDADARPPFLLFVHLWDPHYDYIPPPPFDTRFDPSYQGTFDFSDLEFNLAINPSMPVALYDGEIAATDAVVGDLLAALARHGWLDHTLVVLTSDHGEQFFEDGDKGHLTSLYDEVLHVPLVFRLPGAVRAGQRSDAVVDSVHLMPTILGVAGIDPGREARGRDLGPVLRGGRPPADLWALSELTLRQRLPLYAARLPDRKYLARVTEKEPLSLAVVSYDVHADPEEQHPRNPLDAEEHAFADWLTTHLRTLEVVRRALPRAGGAPAPLDEETERQLRALGYID